MAGRAPKAAVRSKTAGERFAVIVARFNEAISKKLLDGALEALAAHGVGSEAAEVHWVPGSFELPQAAAALAKTGRYSAIICLGVVVKGQTPHFELVAGAAAQGITRAALASGVPVSFGVVTALTEEQAWERAGGAVGNRGEEAAAAALEMARWTRGLTTGRAGRGGVGRRRRGARSPRRR
ncbi:MAG TPA: 6,7-dimethyl-8-ribityllumazine synthase [Methylomirabilota bacterium]|nr:6,7-dimethyl-8-ribityllumazine synthase [Methylomirabilota bacterium]